MTAFRRRSRLSPLRPAGAVLWAAVLLVFAGLVVPLIHANRFRTDIQSALSNSLGRKVEIGEVTLNLLTGPGFQLHNVIVAEDPAFGAEHFAYMDSMQARLRLRTLWTGQVQLASLTLSEPSINLVKNSQGKWNFEALLERARGSTPAARPSAGPPAYFPYIGIQDGRVNFKFGDTKSVFHFQDVDAALSPARDAEGKWRIRFNGRPARTDRILSGMGRFTGEGEIRTVTRMVHLDLALERSPLEHLFTVLRNRDFGIHGEFGAQARLDGHVSRIQIQGTVRAGDVHRWDLMPVQESRFEAPFVGSLNLPAQQLDLETDLSGATPPPVQVRLMVEHYLTAPAWKAAVGLEGAPAGPLLTTARNLGAALPAGIELRGVLHGRLNFSGSLWPAGQVRLEQGQILLPQCPPVTIDTAEAELQGPAFSLAPVAVEAGQEKLKVSAAGRLDDLSLEAQVEARGARLARLRKYVQAVRPGWADSLAGGAWDGNVQYRKQAGRPGAWSGSGTLRDASWQPAGIDSPIAIAQARVQWEPGTWNLTSLSGAAGDTEFSGNCRRRDGQDHCRLRIPELDLQQLDRWLNPEQKRSRWEVWRQVLGRTTPAAPSWLKAANVQGSVTVDHLRLGQWSFHNVRSELAWNADTLVLQKMQAELGKGSVNGALRAEFSGTQPRYSLQATVRKADVKSLAVPAALPANFQRGTMDLRLALSAEGRTAEDLRAGLKAAGTFTGRSIILDNVEWKELTADSSEVELRSVEGRFEWSKSGLELSGLRMAFGKEVYQGRGLIGGRLLLEVAAHGRSSRLVGAALEP